MISEFDKILIFIIVVFIALEIGYLVNWFIAKYVFTPIYRCWQMRKERKK